MAGRGGMQVIELSNHPADMLSAVSLRRQAADQRAHDRHEDALVRHQASVQAIRVKRDRARAAAAGGPGCGWPSPSGPRNAARPRRPGRR